jgi:spermidine/putrescine transport system substrate-binding protein
MHPYFLTPLDRRELLKRGLLVLSLGASPSLLSACGGGDDEAAPPATTQAAEPQAPEASGTIDYLSWEGYDIPGPMKPWKQENGVKVQPTYIGNHDDIQAKILAGGGAAGYDLITYYQGYKPLYAELDILTPIDTNKIPNIENEFPYFKSDVGNFWIDPDGTWTGVPWTWGAIGITYDSDAISELSSWYDLLDPKFKGKIAMVDDPVGGTTLAAHILGHDPASMTEQQYAEVQDLLKQFAAQSKGISPSFGDMTTLLVSGEAVACFQGWAAMNSFAADAGKKTVKTNLPEEGSFSFCDLYAIPRTADNVDTVHAWINEALTPETNAAAAEFLVAAVTVERAVELLDEATRALYPYDDLQLGETTEERIAALFERAPFYNNPPVESDQYVTFADVQKGWQEIKAAA